MNLIVCVKQVFDPETPAASFKIDPEKKRAIPPKEKPMVISPYDESAVEAALKVKDANAGTKVTVLSMGGDSAKEVIKHGLAMGGDEGVQLTDPAFDDSDSFATASILAEAIKKIGPCDIIFCGRQEADWDAGQVGSGIAELLGIPSVTAIKKIQVKDGTAVVERILPDGYEVVEVPLPVLVTVSNEIGEPRYATLKGIMAAAKKKVTNWSSKDVPAVAAKNKMLKLFIPVREAKCEFITGETPEEAGAKLAVRLREAKLF
ncbi:MAG: electron transfer flavoprotein subunit beta/FixA family protein [Dehalococcoidia bacterium]|nr:electron transfer flavoprotein subunit beta/FixA family protein [Dehalococcoidia bacterium]